MDHSRLLWVFGFVALGVMSRFLPHPPNFTSINAIALFSAFHLPNLWLSLLVVYSSMFFSDLVLGLHSTMAYVYLSFSLVVLMGGYLNHKKTFYRLPGCCVVASFLFFIISNFGVWMIDGLYPKTFHGLILCYFSAIPFLLNQILGDFVYSALLFGCFALTEKALKRC